MPKILSLGKAKINFALRSLIRIFDSVEDTHARKSSSELALFSRLIRIFAKKYGKPGDSITL